MGIHLMAKVDSNLAKLAGNQLPFITSVALNRTATGARDLVRSNLPKRFTLRNNWTRGGIQSVMSNKSSLMAQVLAPDYMAIQETGGERSPRVSSTLAAPAEKTNRVIPKGLRPRAMIQSGKAFVLPMSNGNAGVFQRTGKKRKDIKLLYTLSDQQSYEERFHFEDDVRAYVMTKFSVNFAAAFAQAMDRG